MPTEGESLSLALGCSGAGPRTWGSAGRLCGSPMEADWDGEVSGGLDTTGTRGEGPSLRVSWGLGQPLGPTPFPGFLLPTSTQQSGHRRGVRMCGAETLGPWGATLGDQV